MQFPFFLRVSGVSDGLHLTVFTREEVEQCGVTFVRKEEEVLRKALGVEHRDSRRPHVQATDHDPFKSVWRLDLRFDDSPTRLKVRNQDYGPVA